MNDKAKQNGNGNMTVKGITGALVLVGLIIGGWWGITEKLASAGELKQETASRIGGDYELQYKYDKLDIQRQMQSADRRLTAITTRIASGNRQPTDAEDKVVLRAEIFDLKAQLRDLEDWFRTASIK